MLNIEIEIHLNEIIDLIQIYPGAKVGFLRWWGKQKNVHASKKIMKLIFCRFSVISLFFRTGL